MEKKHAPKIQPQLVRIKDTPYIYIGSDMFEGTLEEVAQRVLDIRKQLETRISELVDCYGSEITSIGDYKKIQIGRTHDEDGLGFELLCWREETPEECRKREEADKKRREAAEKAAVTRKSAAIKRELALLKKLKEKYEEK